MLGRPSAPGDAERFACQIRARLVAPERDDADR
jgi:hypothetical protein